MKVETIIWENARIVRTQLGYEDHGILTAVLQLEGKNWTQCFGGRALVRPEAFKNFVEGVLKVTSAECWERVQGCLVQAGVANGKLGPVVALRQILGDQIFAPHDHLDEYAAMFTDEDLAKKALSDG